MVFLLVGVFPLMNKISLSQALVFMKQMDYSLERGDLGRPC